MKKITYSELFNILRDEGYSRSRTIQLIIGQIRNMDPDIKRFFIDWCKDGKVENFDVMGVSYVRLTIDYGMRPVRAFLFLDWLCREPKAALSVLRKIDITYYPLDENALAKIDPELLNAARKLAESQTSSTDDIEA